LSDGPRGRPASRQHVFFIVTARAAAIDGKYTAFGRVVDGMEVVEASKRWAVEGEAAEDAVDLLRSAW